MSSYNNRLQPTQLRTYNPSTNTDVLNLNYSFTNSSGTNNGNVVSFTSTATQVFMRTYTYDELNRVSTMSSPADASGCYGLTWTYDAWGNRLSQTTAGGSGSACASPGHAALANNRITDTGFSHDSSGNMTSDNVHAYTFDAESQLTQVDRGSTATYVYDASGQRVRKTAGGVTTDYVLDASGNTIAEIQGSTWTRGYVYGGGGMIAQYDAAVGGTGATTIFAHTDHLGTTRLMTSVSESVSDSMDYLPYGELLTGGSATSHKFTGKERDQESGLDEFGARYYASNLGRFVTPDWSTKPVPVPYSDLTDPQTLNLYGYVRNIPSTKTDPDGHNWGDDVKQWFQALLAPFSSAKQQMDTGNPAPQTPNPSPVGLTLQNVATKESEIVGTTISLLGEGARLIDPVGLGSVAKDMAQHDNKNTLLDMAMIVLPGGSHMGFSEAKGLVGSWEKGTFDKLADTISYHFGKHGEEVGAKNVWDYMKKAESFSKNLKGATTKDLGDGVTRYYKNGKYIDMDKAKKILSFGKQ